MEEVLKLNFRSSSFGVEKTLESIEIIDPIFTTCKFSLSPRQKNLFYLQVGTLYYLVIKH